MHQPRDSSEISARSTPLSRRHLLQPPSAARIRAQTSTRAASIASSALPAWLCSDATRAGLQRPMERRCIRAANLVDEGRSLPRP